MKSGQNPRIHEVAEIGYANLTALVKIVLNAIGFLCQENFFDKEG